jgi:hypothetical protein
MIAFSSAVRRNGGDILPFVKFLIFGAICVGSGVILPDRPFGGSLSGQRTGSIHGCRDVTRLQIRSNQAPSLLHLSAEGDH